MANKIVIVLKAFRSAQERETGANALETKEVTTAKAFDTVTQGFYNRGLYVGYFGKGGAELRSRAARFLLIQLEIPTTNMTKIQEFDGEIGKPIQWCVKVKATATDTGFQGEANWRFLNGSCSVNLEIKNGQFAVSNFKVHHNTSGTLEKAMQERGLHPGEVNYLQRLFEQTIES